MKKVRLGIIGCGIAARDLHWPALKQLQDKFEITMVCNHTEEKAKIFSELVGGVPYVLDYHELLRSDRVEAVDIALPIELNYPVTGEALKAGKHVIVEKPLAKNMSEAAKMRNYPEKFSQVILVAENFRYRQAFTFMRKQMTAGKIGQVYGCQWNVTQHMTKENKYANTRWRIRHQYPGGFITDGGVHFIAALRLLLGEFRSGTAFTHSVNPEIGEIDTFSLQYETESGVKGILNLFYSAPGLSENQLTVFGDKGSIMLNKNQEVEVNLPGNEFYTKKYDNDLGYKEEFLDFYAAIREGKQVFSSVEQAYKDLEVIISALNSAGSGRKFYLKS